MKKWSVVLALLLCVIAIGGLAVLFKEEAEPSEGIAPTGIMLSETRLYF